MRLLFVSHSFPPQDLPDSNIGGMQRVAVELFTALESRRDITLKPLVLRTSWKWTHIKTAPFLLEALLRTRTLARRKQIDVVLFSSMVTASLSVPLRRTLQLADVKSVAIIHGRDVTLPVYPYQTFVPHVFDSLDAILPVSQATAEACIQRGLSREKVHVIPNGVSRERFDLPPDRKHERYTLMKELDLNGCTLPEESILLCSVGRHVRRKGFGWFIREVMPLLPDHVHYWLAGEGPEQEEIRSAAESARIANRVRLLGRVSDAILRKLYRAADLFIMPNIRVPGDMEGFGVVMLEAGLCGLPTIAADLEGIRDVISNGHNGHLVPSENSRAFAGTILQYLQDRDQLSRASDRTARYVAEKFSWERTADQYASKLKEIVNS